MFYLISCIFLCFKFSFNLHFYSTILPCDCDVLRKIHSFARLSCTFVPKMTTMHFSPPKSASFLLFLNKWMKWSRFIERRNIKDNREHKNEWLIAISHSLTSKTEWIVLKLRILLFLVHEVYKVMYSVGLNSVRRWLSFGKDIYTRISHK